MCRYSLSLTHSPLLSPLSLSLSLSLPQSPDKPYKIHGNILVFVERMDEEFTKVLQATDPHSTDFVTKYEHHYLYYAACTYMHYSSVLHLAV